MFDLDRKIAKETWAFFISRGLALPTSENARLALIYE